MAKSPTFKLIQLPDGTWQCRCRVLNKAVGSGKDPNEAVESMQRAIKDYNEFCDHNYGRCGEGCSRCDEKPETRGTWQKLLSKNSPFCSRETVEKFDPI